MSTIPSMIPCGYCGADPANLVKEKNKSLYEPQLSGIVVSDKPTMHVFRVMAFSISARLTLNVFGSRGIFLTLMFIMLPALSNAA